MVIVISFVIGGVSGLSGLSLIGYFNCPIKDVRFQPAVRLHRRIITVQND